jgi:glycosidase
MMLSPLPPLPLPLHPQTAPPLAPLSNLPAPFTMVSQPRPALNRDQFQRMQSTTIPVRSYPRFRINTSFSQPLWGPLLTKPPGVNAVQPQPQVQWRWQNDLKQMFHRNEAVIYALNVRTFGAQDKNKDGHISVRLGENGTFLSAINQLDQLVTLGVNTVHVLPINPIGQTKRLGNGGSLYAPSDYHRLNPEFDTPGNNLDAIQEARLFVEECHKRGIHVMVDVPSCASADLAKTRPELILKDKNGKTLTPTNWIDIVMFKNDDALRQYFEGFFDLMANKVGVDGFRVDVARARTIPFWQHFIGKYPDKAWLAESYCEEDQSPLKNLPRDIPEDLLKAGFDSFYGQFHIFHSMNNAKEYMDYLLSNRAMFQRASKAGGNDKSFIGSFLTHDDPSLMEHGGVPMCLLASGLMATQPWTNPYILDGFTTGYTGDFDIFNYVPQHKGNHPEIGLFLKHMLMLRKAYGPVLTQGSFIPIPVQGNDPNNQVIAFARQAAGKTLLIVANKDINARQKATLNIPGLNPSQAIRNLVPSYGRPSYFNPGLHQLSVDLGPGRFHMFEINTPGLTQKLKAY